jgi:integrase/recombinase XerD
MANRTVHLSKLIQTPKGPRYCPAVMAANGRVRPDVVSVNGKEERHSEGAYYISWYEGKKLVRKSVGKDAQDAAFERSRKEAELNAANHGVAVTEQPQDGSGNGRRSLAAAVTEYLADIKLNKKHKTHSAYSTALEYFLESCKKPHLEDIDRRDLLKFSAFLRDEKNQAPRSVHNKFSNVLGFLRSQGITEKIVKKEDWPQYTEEETEVYEQAELDTLFAACDAEERLWFEFFLMTGMREQEVMYCCWKDVNLVAATVRVSHKPEYLWTPKAYRERTIPVPETLVDSLRAWKAKATKGCPLIFPTAGCRPKLDFLDCLKACAERAELEQDDFWLHKFRATFATWHLWAGIDLSTVQLWLGHKDLASTMRYLKPSRSQATRDKVNATFAASTNGDAQ